MGLLMRHAWGGARLVGRVISVYDCCSTPGLRTHNIRNRHKTRAFHDPS
jgi:hypothetical protein